MELNAPDFDDLNNKNIEINKSADISSTESSQSSENKDSNAFKNFISGFKNFLKPKLTSTEIEKDNINNDVPQGAEDSNNITTVSENNDEEFKKETCKDKIANKIIQKLEVEKSIGIFSVLICIGSVLICFSFFLLPLIITSPRKFSFCFAVGSIFILISFLFLVGTRNYVTKLLDNKRIFISISFILSIFIGIAFSLGSHYFISLICSGIQLISMIMFILTFIPGGRVGIDCIKNTLKSPFTKLFINKAKTEISEM